MADEEVRVEVDGRTLTLSNLGKVLYPVSGTTKGEVLHYYAQVAPVLLPHLRDRAVTRIRWPHGTAQSSFFEKNLPNGSPSWLRTAKVPTTGSRAAAESGGTAVPGTITFPVVDDLAALTYLVNLAALELHVHQWTVGADGHPENPNRMVVDLDPGPPAGLHECCRVALMVRQALADRGLSCAPVTSGSKGLHLYAALPGELTPDEVRDEAQALAQQLTREHPDLVLWRMTRSLRPGKVFLDWSQNAGSKTTISPYSLRGKEQPFVAAPRTWEEVEEGAEVPGALQQLDHEEVLARASEHGDLFGRLLHGQAT